jgi:hypothetical protein
MWQRLSSWPSTLLGLVAALWLAVKPQLPPDWQALLDGLGPYAPALGLLVWGVAIKGGKQALTETFGANLLAKVGNPKGIKHVFALLLLPPLLLGLVACATPQVTMPAGVASVMYAQGRADYAVAKVLVTQACKAGKWDKAACEAAKEIDLRAQTYRSAIEGALINPTQPVDWAQVLAYTQSVSELLLKLGVLP